MLRSKRTPLLFPAAAALALTGLLTACGGGGSASVSDGSSSSSDTGSAGGSASAVLGTPNKATGSTITIGIMNPGKEESIDTTNETVAAESVFAYANDYLGGINGHKIAFFNCDTMDTPAKSADCANQMIQKKVSAVIQGSGNDTAITTLQGGGIPLVTTSSATSTAFASTTAFSLANPLVPFGAPATYAKEQKFTKAAFFVIDVPAASGPAGQLAPLFFKNAGATVKVVTVPPGTADMSPQVQTAISSGAQMYYMIGDPAFCTSALKAIKTLAPSAKVVLYSSCVTSGAASSIPGGYAGTKTVTTQVLDPTDAETKLYAAIVKKYGGEVTGQAALGYTAALGLVRAANAAKVTDITAAGMLAAIKSAPAVPLPVGGGATFQCNGTAVGLSKIICSSAGDIADTATDGSLSNFTVLSDNSIYSVG